MLYESKQGNDTSTASGLLSTAQSYPSLTNEAITSAAAAAMSQSELSSDSDQDLVDMATGGSGGLSGGLSSNVMTGQGSVTTGVGGGPSGVRALEVMIDADDDKQSDLDNDDDYEDVMVSSCKSISETCRKFCGHSMSSYRVKFAINEYLNKRLRFYYVLKVILFFSILAPPGRRRFRSAEFTTLGKRLIETRCMG